MHGQHSYRRGPLYSQCHLCDKDKGIKTYLGCLAGPASCASCHCMCTNLLNATVEACLKTHKLLATTVLSEFCMQHAVVLHPHICQPTASDCAAPARLAVCKNACVVAVHNGLNQWRNLRKHIRLRSHRTTPTS